MTMRADALKHCKHTTGDDGKPACSTEVTVTHAHWEEARVAVGEDRDLQAKYLRNEAIAACKSGCECVQNVVGMFVGNTVVAGCAENTGDLLATKPHTFTKA